MRKIFSKNIDTSGKMFKQNYLGKYFPTILKEIITYSFNNNLSNIQFKQQVYHWYHNIPKMVKCKECDNNVKFKNSTIGYYSYCSRKCADKSNITKKKRIDTNMNRFGSRTPAESDVVKEKMIKTNIERYNNKCPLSNMDVKQKSINTLMKNYGVDSPLKSKVIMDKLIRTNTEIYGYDNVMKVQHIRDKALKTTISRYGVSHAMKNKNIAKKSINNLYKSLNNKLVNYYKEYDIIEIDNENKMYTIKCKHGHKFNITYVLLNSRRKTNTEICTICNPIDKSVSGLELQLLEFIKNSYDGLILENIRDIIPPYELDIYLPHLKLAFEFNGLFWHNELNKPTNYHKIKSDLCEDIDIQLIHIYEDDWVYRQNIVKSMILNKIKKTPNKVYARNTTVREVNDTNMIKKFLNNNHIQGFTGSNIKIGLFNDDTMISLMTFGKNRRSMSNGTDNSIELIRFCNKINVNVVGGASKLFKYFRKNYNFNHIITYADRSYSNGKLYDKLGFKYIHKTRPNYHYVIDKTRRYRFNYRKDKLIKEGFDKNKTEHEIMLERGIYRIYNSGNLKYQFIKEN